MANRNLRQTHPPRANLWPCTRPPNIYVYSELGYEVRPVEIFQDNKSSITLSSEEALNFKGRSKFINRKFFGIYELIQNNDLKLSYVCTEDMIADVLTKAMVGNKFKRFAIALLGCKSIPSSD